MKRALLLIALVLGSLHAYAQEYDSLRVQSSTTAIDSLSLKLQKLQHDLDFKSCDFELHRLKMELNEMVQDICIKTNGLLIEMNHGRYNSELYTSYSRSYDVYCSLFNSLKYKQESVKTLVMLKMAVCNFSDEEREVIYASFSSINESISLVESTLDYYATAIEVYRSKRW